MPLDSVQRATLDVVTEQPPKPSRRLKPAKVSVDPATWTTWLVPLLAFAVIGLIAPGNLGPAKTEFSRFIGLILLAVFLGIVAYRKWGTGP